jgi:hypothetical protein
MRKRLRQWALDHGTTVQGIFDKMADSLLSDGVLAVNTPEMGVGNSPGIGGSESPPILLKPEGNEILETLQEILSVLRRLTIQVDALTETSGASPRQRGKATLRRRRITASIGNSWRPNCRYRRQRYALMTAFCQYKEMACCK